MIENEIAPADAIAFANESAPGPQPINSSKWSHANEKISPTERLDGHSSHQDRIVTPEDARAFCARSQDTDSEVEPDADTLPTDVKQAGASAWRCMDHKALVCDLGATGMACMKTGSMTADRLEAFNKFCREHPDSNHIPHSLTIALASVWRCAYTNPVQMSTTPIDEMAYYKHSWRVLD
jgi:hypothetical protein